MSETCPNCKGIGRFDAVYVTCKCCDGTGKAPAPEADSTSETPRSDAAQKTAENRLGHWDVWGFARQLERELAQAIKERDEAQRIGPIEPNFYTAKLEQQLATLREALETELRENMKHQHGTTLGEFEYFSVQQARRIKTALASI